MRTPAQQGKPGRGPSTQVVLVVPRGSARAVDRALAAVDPADGHDVYVADRHDAELRALIGERGLPDSLIPRIDHDSVLSEYLQLVGRLAEHNADRPAWSVTDVASKNRFKSPLPALLEELVCCIDVVRQARERGTGILLVGVSWPVIAALRDPRNALSGVSVLALRRWARPTSRQPRGLGRAAARGPRGDASDLPGQAVLSDERVAAPAGRPARVPHQELRLWAFFRLIRPIQ